MQFLTKSQLVACLAACMTVIPSVTAAPVTRDTVRLKRVVLWDWTNSRDYTTYPAIKASADVVSTSAKVRAVINWGTVAPSEISSNVFFQPMIRSTSELEGDSWNAAVAQAQKYPYKIVHFFNEPERNGISVADALSIWRSKMLPLRTTYKARLVSPGVASSGEGTTWLAEFMSQLGADEKPDFLGTHFYTNADSPVDTEIAAAKSYLSERIATYGIPLAVSEIGCTSRDATQVTTFTESMATWMDANESVYEYGFFGASRVPVDSFVSPAAQLMDTTGAWTALGSWLLSA